MVGLELQRNKIFSSFNYGTDLNKFHPFLYDFHPEKIVYKMTFDQFVNDQCNFNNISIYFLYGNLENLSDLLKKINTIEDDKIRCFVIVQNQKDFLQIQQGQTYITDLQQSIHNLQYISNSPKLMDVLKTEYNVLITKGLPMYFKTFFKAVYEIHNCHDQMSDLFNGKENSMIWNNGQKIYSNCEMVDGTENSYYLFKGSTDINFDLETFEFNPRFTDEEFVNKVIPKMLFVNLMMDCDFNMMDVLNYYSNFRTKNKNANNFAKLKNLLREPNYIIHFGSLICLLNFYSTDENVRTVEIQKFHSIFSENYNQNIEIYNEFDEPSKKILATKYSFGAFL